jgi:3(or 17)beta-hydroxysteroid dehydrogenase
MKRVEGKVVLVTGAASGLGLACARRLAQEGARVVMGDVARDAGEAAAAEIEGADFAYLDVTSESAWEALIGSIVAEHGRLDVLVNCAGVAVFATIEDTTEEIWRRVNSVGTDGTFYGCKHALEAMKPQGSGSIINMCSTASIQGAPKVFAYAASKSAIRGMTKSVACLSTLEGYGIRCNSVHPGNMDTPMLQNMAAIVAEVDPEGAAGMETLWVGEPVDVANMILFLASDESRSVNGAAMVVDNTTSITEGAVHRIEQD